MDIRYRGGTYGLGLIWEDSKDMCENESESCIGVGEVSTQRVVLLLSLLLLWVSGDEGTKSLW